MTKLCIAIFVCDLSAARRDMARAAEAGADMVELRLDGLTEAKTAQALALSSPLPVIFTCRPASEGGACTLDEQARLDLLHSAAVGNAAYVDIELQTLQSFAGPLPKLRRIVSSHDFSGRPAKLLSIVEELFSCDGDIAKIVWTARSIRDNLEAFEILQHRSRPTIALCMGEHGLLSRVLAGKFGAFLTFAALETGRGTADGQVAIADMKNLYRWDAIGPATKLYGVVASPVMHSLSPAIHNAAFDHLGYDGVYLPMLVNPGYESFKAFMESFLAFPALDLSGLSVTLPHKENALRYLREAGADIEDLATRIGAVNTIVIAPSASGKPSLRGFNTDYRAILDSITSALGISDSDLAGRHVAVIGSGGTGRTAVAALTHCRANVVIYNRTIERAQALASEFACAAAPLDEVRESSCDIYINTTSIGMFPNVDASPLGDAPPQWGPGTLVFDTVYNPMRTRLLQQADAAGAQTIGGIEMFVRQAAGQFQAWTGQPAPKDVMRRVIEQRLATSAA